MRNKTNDEFKNPHVLPRKLATITCHKCGSVGYNMRAYKGKTKSYTSMPKGGNNTKKPKTRKGNGKNKKSKSATQPTQEVRSCSQGPQATKNMIYVPF